MHSIAGRFTGYLRMYYSWAYSCIITSMCNISDTTVRNLGDTWYLHRQWISDLRTFVRTGSVESATSFLSM